MSSFRTAWMTENDYMVYNEKEAIEKYVGTLSEGPGWFWIDLFVLSRTIQNPGSNLKRNKFCRLGGVKIFARAKINEISPSLQRYQSIPRAEKISLER